jgi:hypothetical protein
MSCNQHEDVGQARMKSCRDCRSSLSPIYFSGMHVGMTRKSVNNESWYTRLLSFIIQENISHAGSNAFKKSAFHMLLVFFLSVWNQSTRSTMQIMSTDGIVAQMETLCDFIETL